MQVRLAFLGGLALVSLTLAMFGRAPGSPAVEPAGTRAPLRAHEGRVSLPAIMNAPSGTPLPTSPAGDPILLVARGGTWRYWDFGADLGTIWRSPAFDDASWASGPAPLGYGDAMSTTVAGGPIGGRHITTYFRKTFGVADPGLYATLTLHLRRDDGAVIYLNGHEVTRSNMPAGDVTSATLAASTVGGLDEAAFFSYALPVSHLAPGANTLAVEIHQRAVTSSDIAFDLALEAQDGTDPTPTATPPLTATLAPTLTAEIVAAGDIASCSNGLAGAHQTADLINALPDARVLALGDLAYSAGTDAQFQECYHPTWGKFKDRTWPTPGNHEYRTAGAAGYFNYFEAPPYYSWEFAGWHFVSLNSEIDYSPGSAQLGWLGADLAATGAKCILAYWHRPRFSSGAVHGSDPSLGAVWEVLLQHGASVALAGHEHHYERFDRQDANGLASATGIREFVVGTGGVGFYGFASTPLPNSQFQLTNVYGVLRLQLQPSAYAWQFLAIDGTVRDAGTSECSRRG